MKDNDLIREVMSLRGHTFESLAELMGYSGRSSISERLRGKYAMRVDTFYKMLKEMNCEIVVRSKLKDKTEWVLDFEVEE